ncbi:MAG TPA: hypothetical protein PLP48_00195 [Acholeplasmataceae bacterium]|nr:hypothetical protein [Acholeplasmataceae bacterium]
MKHKKLESLALYNTNPESKAYVVEVSLDDYSELFNGWDASPLRRKDLEPELMDYLEQAATEIPIREKLELCFYMPKEKRDLDKEFKSITSVMNNFKVVLSTIHKQLSHNYRRLAIYIIISLIFLSAAYLLRNVTHISLFINIMIEGFFIGGWFLLWEAFSLFFFDTHETRVRQKFFNRFLISDIYFKDTKE